MAKSKQETASNEVEPVNLVGEAGDELATLRAENERLKAELANRDAEISAIISAPVEIEAVDPPGRFKVSLMDAPTWIVEAASSAHAWDAYKAATGVINSIHAPEVRRVNADTPLGRCSA